MINKVLHGDCLEKLKDLADNSVDAVVTDPPYGLSFMGKKWDYDVPSEDIWRECLRVLKPGGYLLAFAGTRTQHRMAVRIEDAGFEIRDMIAWVYGSGFPKSLNIGKAIDALGGQSLDWFIEYILKFAEEKGISRKELTMIFPSKNRLPTGWLWNKQKTQGITVEQFNKIKDFLKLPFNNIEETEREVIGKGKAGLTAGNIANFSGEKEFDLTKGNSEYEGWGTALKPALEPITVARKPLSEKTVALNVLKWGTGGIDIDGSRVEFLSDADKKSAVPQGIISQKSSKSGVGAVVGGKNDYEANKEEFIENQTGRFPANFIHDGSDEVVAMFPNTKSGAMKKAYEYINNGNSFGAPSGSTKQIHESSEGNASRFFYCAKASKSERNAGCEDMEEKSGVRTNAPRENEEIKTAGKKNFHPTVKPIALMEYLVKLVSKENAIILDPFGGSGSTAVACKNTNRNYILIEREEDYIPIINARIENSKPKIVPLTLF